MTYEFTIVSKTHGLRVVTVPLRFKEQIEQHTWHLIREPGRAVGRQMVVRTWLSRSTILTLHRFIWDLAGNPPVAQIDHKDGQPLNNGEDNLRAATRSQNQHNRRKGRANTSGVIGVSRCRRRHQWQAGIKINNKSIHLGNFDSITEAQLARDIAAVKYHSEFAVLNTPTNPAVTPEEYRALIEQLAS